MIDIIIPTLLKTPEILDWSIHQALESKYINQIIIIDNSEQKLFRNNTTYLNAIDKIKLLEMPENIYVNPAWNLGAEIAQAQYLLFINDDVFVDKRVYQYLYEVICQENMGICSVSVIDTDDLTEYQLQFNKIYQETLQTSCVFAYRPYRFNMEGAFFCLPKKIWKPIPHNLKLLWGDALIYRRIRLLGYDSLNITNVIIGHKPHSTMNSIRKKVRKIRNRDNLEYINCHMDYYND